MGRFVRIQSSRTINVTGGLQLINATNENSQNPDRLNVRPLWPDLTVLIKAGIGYYPAVIQEWETVKSLADREVLTIGKEVDECPNQEEVEKVCEKIERAYKNVEKNAPKKQQAKKPTLFEE